MAQSAELLMLGPSSSCLRLHQLQRVCANQKLAALVFITGIDSKHSETSLQTLRYLFTSASGADIERSNPLDHRFEDAILVVLKNRVSLYLSRKAYQNLLPVFGLWPGLTVYCPTEEEENDTDLYEDHKMKSFLDMVRGFQKGGVGMALQKGGDAMQVEEWPLVQAYALDEAGGSGFFTMRHVVTDVTPTMRALFHQIDAPAVLWLLRGAVPMLLTHWQEMTSLLDAATADGRLRLTEAQVVEPLLTYYNYGRIRTDNKGSPNSDAPSVKFGVHTSSQNPVPTGHSAGDSGPDNGPALHFSVEATDPRTFVHCARTYFFGSQAQSSVGSPEKEEEQTEYGGGEGKGPVKEQPGSEDVRFLIQLYAALVSACRGAMAPASDADARALEQAVVERFRQALPLHLTDVMSSVMDAVMSSLRVETWSVDPLTGARADLRTGGRNVCVLKARIADVAGIADVERVADVSSGGSAHKSPELGDLLFAESFISEPQNCGSRESDSQPDCAGTCLVLTDAIPALATWLGAGSEEDTYRSRKDDLSRLMASVAPLGEGPVVFPSGRTPRSGSPTGTGRAFSSLGSPLQELGEDTRMVLECELAPSVEGGWYTFESGVVFESARLGLFTLDFTADDVSKAHVYRNASDHAPEALVFLCARGKCPVISTGVYSHLLLPEAVGCNQSKSETVDENGHAESNGGDDLPSFKSSGTNGITRTGEKMVAVTFDLLALTPTARKHFTRNVLPVWESVWERNGIRFGHGLELPLPTLLVNDAHDREAGFGGLSAGYGAQKTFSVTSPDLSVAVYLHGLEIRDAEERCQELGVNAGGKSPEIRKIQPEGPIYITVVAGTPGSGKHLLVSDVVKNTERRWHVIDTGASFSPLVLDGVKLEAELSRVYASVRAPKETGNGQPKKSPRVTFVGLPDHCLVIGPGLVPINRVMEIVRSSEAVKSGRFEVASVATCVEAKLFFEDAGRWKPAPGALEQLTAGLVDTIFLMDAAEEDRGAISSFIQAVNPLASLTQVTRSNLNEFADRAFSQHGHGSSNGTSARGTTATLPGLDLTSDLAAALSAWAGLAEGLAKPLAFMGSDELEDAVIKCTGQIDEETLKWELAGLFSEMSLSEPASPVKGAAPKPSNPRLCCVLGSVRNESGELSKITATRASVRVDRLDESPTDVRNPAPGAEVHFVGVKPLDRGLLRRVLERSQVSVPSFKQEARAETLAPEEVAALEEKHRGEPLPPGWHFDGVWYVNSWGEKSAQHPDMEDWVGDFLKSKNERVKAHNEGVRSRRSSLVPLRFD